MTEDGLPPLRDVIERHGLGAKKALGQNFLFDLNLTRRIARAAGPFDGPVIEVGPGPGGLTRALLMEGAPLVIAIERDSRALPALADISDAYPGRLQVIDGDALQQDWSALAPAKAQIVANLPYNIGTLLLTNWLTEAQRPPWFSRLTLMFQKEVAQRICAAPDTGDYGRLSVLCQYRCNVRKLFDVNRNAFIPAPKVTSSVVQLVPKDRPAPHCDISKLERVTAAGFGQRRKMLRSSLRSLFADPVPALERVGVSPSQRAETLTVEQFALLAQMVD
jgi:16S rRNA (adenine1518-N6/adenine1519-N6)-dimethyltransferase